MIYRLERTASCSMHNCLALGWPKTEGEDDSGWHWSQAIYMWLMYAAITVEKWALLAIIGNLKLTALSSPVLFIFVVTVWILTARREESQNKTSSPFFQFSFDGDIKRQVFLNIQAEWCWFRLKEASSDIFHGLKLFKPSTSISFFVTEGHT